MLSLQLTTFKAFTVNHVVSLYSSPCSKHLVLTPKPRQPLCVKVIIIITIVIVDIIIGVISRTITDMSSESSSSSEWPYDRRYCRHQSHRHHQNGHGHERHYSHHQCHHHRQNRHGHDRGYCHHQSHQNGLGHDGRYCHHQSHQNGLRHDGRYCHHQSHRQSLFGRRPFSPDSRSVLSAPVWSPSTGQSCTGPAV